jgi:hypothetical protein
MFVKSPPLSGVNRDTAIALATDEIRRVRTAKADFKAICVRNAKNQERDQQMQGKTSSPSALAANREVNLSKRGSHKRKQMAYTPGRSLTKEEVHEERDTYHTVEETCQQSTYLSHKVQVTKVNVDWFQPNETKTATVSFLVCLEKGKGKGGEKRENNQKRDERVQERELDEEMTDAQKQTHQSRSKGQPTRKQMAFGLRCDRKAAETASEKEHDSIDMLNLRQVASSGRQSHQKGFQTQAFAHKHPAIWP